MLVARAISAKLGIKLAFVFLAMNKGTSLLKENLCLHTHYIVYVIFVWYKNPGKCIMIWKAGHNAIMAFNEWCSLTLFKLIWFIVCKFSIPLVGQWNHARLNITQLNSAQLNDVQLNSAQLVGAQLIQEKVGQLNRSPFWNTLLQTVNLNCNVFLTPQHLFGALHFEHYCH